MSYVLKTHKLHSIFVTSRRNNFSYAIYLCNVNLKRFLITFLIQKFKICNFFDIIVQRFSIYESRYSSIFQKIYFLFHNLKNITNTVLCNLNNNKSYYFKLKLREKTVFFLYSLSVLCYDFVVRYGSRHYDNLEPATFLQTKNIF